MANRPTTTRLRSVSTIRTGFSFRERVEHNPAGEVAVVQMKDQRFASGAGKKGGEFYPPHEVSELLARLVAPSAGARICDPTCGSGSLLITVAEQVKDKMGEHSRDFALYGQESNGDTWALAKMNMFLHEMDSADIEWGDTINNPKLKGGSGLMKFDVVVANPPFSLDKWGADTAEADSFKRFMRGVPPKSKG